MFVLSFYKTLTFGSYFLSLSLSLSLSLLVLGGDKHKKRSKNTYLPIFLTKVSYER